MMTKIKRVCAKDVMKTSYGTIDGGATIKEAINEMKRLKTNVLVVNKRGEYDEYGLILSSDVADHVLAKDRAPDRVNVYEIMTKPIITVPADMDIRYAARLIYRAGIRRAPVEEKGEIVGMISLSSLILDNELF